MKSREKAREKQHQQDPEPQQSCDLQPETEVKSDFGTPPVSRRLRNYAKDYQQTFKEKIKRHTINGSNMWVFKTEMKVVSGPQLCASTAMKKDLTRSKLKAHQKLADIKLQQNLNQYESKKEEVHRLLERKQMLIGKNRKLKRQLLMLDVTMNRILFISGKITTFDQEIMDQKSTMGQIEELQTNNLDEIQNLQRKIHQTRNMSEQIKQRRIDEEKELCMLMKLRDEKKKICNQLSLTKMPNKKEIISNMFSIGILYEQLYILELEKEIKGKISELQVTSRSNVKKDSSIRKKINLKVNEQQKRRCAKIQCEDSSLVVYKVISLIYIHCRSLSVNNIVSNMRKIAHFSEEFKQIYDFNQYRFYLEELIEKYKGGTLILKERQFQNSGTAQKKVIILVRKERVPYLRWVLQFFEREKGVYVLQIKENQVELELVAIEDFGHFVRSRREEFEEKEPNLLKISFEGCDEHFEVQNVLNP